MRKDNREYTRVGVYSKFTEIEVGETEQEKRGVVKEHDGEVVYVKYSKDYLGGEIEIHDDDECTYVLHQFTGPMKLRYKDLELMLVRKVI